MELQQRISHRKLCYDKSSILLDPHVKTDNVEGENDPLTPTKNNDGDINEEDYLDVFTHSNWFKFGSIAHSEHGDVIADMSCSDTPPSVAEVGLATDDDNEIVTTTTITETPFRKVKPQAIKPAGKIQVL
jgi:hypothetical protein